MGSIKGVHRHAPGRKTEESSRRPISTIEREFILRDGGGGGVYKGWGRGEMRKSDNRDELKYIEDRNLILRFHIKENTMCHMCHMVDIIWSSWRVQR